MVASFVLLLALGLFIGVSGAWLLWLGGSPYYLLAGVAFFVAAFLALRRSPATRLVYVGIVLGTLGWALWEVGLDWWQLGTRGGLIVLLGLWLLTPWALGRRSGWGLGGTALALSLLIAIAVAVFSLLNDPHDQPGQLAMQPVATTATATTETVPPGEWHHYGRTLMGQRYSPLNQITTENLGNLQVAWTYRTGDIKLPQDVSETTRSRR